MIGQADERIYAECLAGGVSRDDAFFFATGGVLVTPHSTGGYDRVDFIGRRMEFTRQARLHRLDGPAVIHPNGDPVFAFDGQVTAFARFLECRGLPVGSPVEMVGVSRDVAMTKLSYRALITALEEGSPWEWAVAYARGTVAVDPHTPA